MEPTAIDGCTVTARNYSAHARVLAESFVRHNPGASFTVLVVDDADCALGSAPGLRTLTPREVGIEEPELARRATMYTAQGLVASLKPALLHMLLAEGGRPVVLLDADGSVYGDLAALAPLAAEHSLLLSPHSLEPHPLWALDSPEQIFLRSGVMNAGLIGVGAGAEPFLRWWGERTARRCVFDVEHALMLGQTWLTLATCLFDHRVLRDPGCNVAGWNLQDREVHWAGDSPTIDGAPLLHFHFAGSYDAGQPDLLTTQPHAHWWPKLQERPGLLRLSREYSDRLLAAGYLQARRATPAFDRTPGGALIEPWMRAEFRRALIASELEGAAEPPNPFSDGDEAFASWLDGRAREHLDAPAGSGSEELVRAMREGERLLERIGELDAARDEAIAWAQRVSAELEVLKGALAELEAEPALSPARDRARRVLQDARRRLRRP